jgi:serine/threonine protein kinase
MESSQFSDNQPHFDSLEQLSHQGSTCDTFCVKLYGKLHFLKRLKPEHTGDIRYQEALRKEFETGYLLEHPHLVRYLSFEHDAILMEYVEGETLSQRIANHPDFFRNHKNTDKFIRQLLDVVGYLHSHQVLHLDLKPDNILLTHINNDVKLIDLGCCFTDSYQDTKGHTNSYAAPEQLSGKTVDERTDIYAIGRILEFLPEHTLYNKVIACCTAENPADRYQSVDEILYAINHRHRYPLWLAIIAFCAVLLFVGIALVTHQKSEPTVIEKKVADSVISRQQDTLQQMVLPPVGKPNQQSPAKDEQTLMKEDAERLIDQAYRSTIATFCDSVFPSPTPSTGKSWAEASTEFHNQTIQIGNRLVKKYPNIPESAIRQDVESRFQSIVSFVFNQMRTNAQQ